jgi:hypothetical protein
MRTSGFRNRNRTPVKMPAFKGRLAWIAAMFASLFPGSVAQSKPVRQNCGELIVINTGAAPMSWIPGRREITTRYDENEFLGFPATPEGVAVLLKDGPVSGWGFYRNGQKIAAFPKNFRYPKFWFDSNHLVYLGQPLEFGGSLVFIFNLETQDFSTYPPLKELIQDSDFLNNFPSKLLTRNGRKFLVLSKTYSQPSESFLVDVDSGEVQLLAQPSDKSVQFFTENSELFRLESTDLGFLDQGAEAYKFTVSSGQYPGDVAHEEVVHGNSFIGLSASGRYFGFLENNRIILHDRGKAKYSLSEPVPNFWGSLGRRGPTKGCFLKAKTVLHSFGERALGTRQSMAPGSPKSRWAFATQFLELASSVSHVRRPQSFASRSCEQRPQRAARKRSAPVPGHR